jgi:hypothetical protein
MITLSEYLDQKEPVRMPYVVLKENDYNLGHWYGVEGKKRASLWIPALSSVLPPNGVNPEYVVIEGLHQVYTTDSDGNPVRSSCFHLENPLKPE